jgi:di/tricarboxylate transporter
MMRLMVVHGAAAGNFSPLNVLGALAKHSVESRGLTLDPWTLFGANLAANLILAAIIVLIFRRPQAFVQSQPEAQPAARATGLRGPGIEGMCTIGAFILVAGISLGFGLSLGLVAFGAGAALQLAFPKSTTGAERHIAWGVVLLVCGVVTYVAALQRYGTVSMAGAAIAAMGTPALVALLLCAVGAVTSAFASSAGILGAMLPLAAPFMLQGTIETTAFVTALALSVTLVDAAPFSTVGALAVASADSSERTLVYRGLLAWGGAMIVAVPIVTWLIFVLPSL